MYYLLECHVGLTGQRASIDYTPDVWWRDWDVGKRFTVQPTVPVVARTTDDRRGELAELIQVPVPLMSRRLAEALVDAGVNNIDYYDAEITDDSEGCTHRSHLAFNLVGAISVADLSRSTHAAPGGPRTSVDFDSLSIDETSARGALMFRLAESVNGIVIHESVKRAIERAGIETLAFTPPAEWIS